MKIFKYTLTGPFTELNVPIGAIYLNADVQRGTDIVAWFLVDPDTAGTQVFRVHAVNTGGECPEGIELMRYLATVTFLPEGVVWHLFTPDLNLPSDAQERRPKASLPTVLSQPAFPTKGGCPVCNQTVSLQGGKIDYHREVSTRFQCVGVGSDPVRYR